MKRKTLLLTIAAILFSSQYGYTQKESVKIGIIVPLTGDVATYGQDLKKGMDIAFEENNRFIPIYQDSKASPKVGLDAMRYLRNAFGVKFFIGDATTTVSLLIAEDAQKNGNILLDPIATGDDIKAKGDFVFMNCPRNERQAILAAKYVAEKYRGKHVGVIYQQKPYGIELSKSFTSELKRNGMDLVLSESVQDIRSGLKKIISKVKSNNLDVVYIPMEYEACAYALKQCRECGITADFIGTDGAYSEKMIELAGDAAEEFCFTMFPVDTLCNYYKEFASKFVQRYNKEPNVFSCYGYESAKNMIYAITQAGADPVAVKQFFFDNAFDSVTGILQFDLTGEVEREFRLVKIVNGKLSTNITSKIKIR